jgi:hypothetical protein
MATETDTLVFDVRPETGSVFTVDGTRVYDPANPVPGSLVFNATNSAGKWIDIVVESIYPTGGRLWTTGQMQDGETRSQTGQLQFNISKAIHITRWAPGIFGIPGSGGGEVFFEMPSSGDVTVNITVTG